PAENDTAHQPVQLRLLDERRLQEVAMDVVNRLHQRPYYPTLAKRPGCGTGRRLGSFAAVTHLGERRGDSRHVDFEEMSVAVGVVLPIRRFRQNAGNAQAGITIVKARYIRMVFTGFGLHVVILGTVEEKAKKKI